MPLLHTLMRTFTTFGTPPLPLYITLPSDACPSPASPPPSGCPLQLKEWVGRIMHMYAAISCSSPLSQWSVARGIRLGVGGGGRWWRQCGGSGAPCRRLLDRSRRGCLRGTVALASDEEEEEFVLLVVLPVMKPPSMGGLRGQLLPLSRQQKQQLIQDQDCVPRDRLGERQ